jgi:hypothetical protein
MAGYAGHRDRGADRLDALDDGAEGPGSGAAPGLSATGPVSRTAYEPGEIGQCDFWFPDVEVPVGSGQTRTATRLPVLVMVCGYSRWLSAMLIPSRAAEDLFAGWWQLLASLGAVPRTLVRDGEAAVERRREDHRADRGHARVPRNARGEGAHLRSGRPGNHGPARAGQRLSRDVVPARADIHLAGRLQHPVADWVAAANTRAKRVLGCAPAARVVGHRCGSRAFTTSVSTPTTTRCTPG